MREMTISTHKDDDDIRFSAEWLHRRIEKKIKQNYVRIVAAEQISKRKMICFQVLRRMNVPLTKRINLSTILGFRGM